MSEAASSTSEPTKAQRLRRPERLARLELPRVLAAFAPVPARVLDIGTGSGVFAQAFAEAGARQVAGVDLSSELIQAARTYLPAGDFRVAPAETLPFAAGTFDLAFMGLMLHESPDMAAALQEARRVAPRLGVLEWAYREEESGPPLSRRLNPPQLEALARAAGFSRMQRLELSEFVLYRLEA